MIQTKWQVKTWVSCCQLNGLWVVFFSKCWDWVLLRSLCVYSFSIYQLHTLSKIIFFSILVSSGRIFTSISTNNIIVNYYILLLLCLSFFSVTANFIWIFHVFVVVISECSLSSCNTFSSIRRLHTLGSREKEAAITFLPSKSLRVSCLGDDRIKRCGSSSTGNGGKDKNGKGTAGNQWSCPKCGNPCTSVKRKWDELALIFIQQWTFHFWIECPSFLLFFILP